MTKRSDLAAQAWRLAIVYSDVARHNPRSPDVDSAGLAIARALGAFDATRATREELDRAADELAAARETLSRLRHAPNRWEDDTSDE